MENLSDKNKKDLSEIAKSLGLKVNAKNTKAELIQLINEHPEVAKATEEDVELVEEHVVEILSETTTNEPFKAEEHIAEPSLPKISEKAQMIGSEGYYEKASYVQL